ncbi:MAG: hypothetical protein QOJ99_5165 [Bryobacterales bacterium]|nr:hypothetical protein [Bryobacterales bacterium]
MMGPGYIFLKDIVADSAYSSFPATAHERIRRVTPSGLSWLTPLFIDSRIAWGRLHYGVRISDASAAQAVRQSHTAVFHHHPLGGPGRRPRRYLEDNRKRI